MATPPGGPSSYGSGHSGQPQDAQPAAAPGGDAPFLNRFNFPSAPSEHVQRSAGMPPQQPDGPYPPQHGPHRPQPPHHPQHQPPHQRQPQHHRIQPVQPTHGEMPAAEERDAEHSLPPQQPLVRPYAMTGGRTRPRYQLAIEALVHTTAESAQLQGQLPEHQRICRLCYEIKSVAEISALLTIPLGVARILVADLAEAGLVAIHQPGGDETTADGQPDVTLLERVLSGLRKL
ncbi:DUF742 domain-containing protein [Streptomyces albus]|uniref:DUF742 domain-containing protein n=1 Tax=Streptomyces albus TaxID=1888 RepID=UPI0024ADA683|nr:DUF742 domain-containing protein [Streptomyces albus]MDI6409482.1 DUF742 domain-containing protein [Streptomyces albus]